MAEGVDRALKNVVRKGKVIIGAKQTKAAINNGQAKLVIMAKNCPYSSEISKLVEQKKTPIYNYNSNSIDLGYACGKNFSVSVFAVIDEGDSNIIQLVKKGNKQ